MQSRAKGVFVPRIQIYNLCQSNSLTSELDNILVLQVEPGGELLVLLLEVVVKDGVDLLEDNEFLGVLGVDE